MHSYYIASEGNAHDLITFFHISLHYFIHPSVKDNVEHLHYLGFFKTTICDGEHVRAEIGYTPCCTKAV